VGEKILSRLFPLIDASSFSSISMHVIILFQIIRRPVFKEENKKVWERKFSTGTV
jgi:hypothetical protein